MKVELRSILEIRPYSKNPRQNKKSIEFVANSIKEYGFQQPIVVDSHGEIIVGHTRYAAAKQLGFTTVPVVVADNLTELQVKAYRIADNKTHEYSVWDQEQLAEELESMLANTDLNNLSYLTAFNEMEIDKLLNDSDYKWDGTEDLKNPNIQKFNKRIALVILSTGYVNRGLATSVNGWIEWGMRYDVMVDIITDCAPKKNNQFIRYMDYANWIVPTNPTDIETLTQYDRTDDITLGKQTIRLEECVRLRESIMTALSKHSYDMIILNNIDCLYTAVGMCLHVYCDNLYYYTHSENDFGWGKSDAITKLTVGLLKENRIKILCATERNRYEFLKISNYDANLITIAPLHLGQPELLDFDDEDEREGLLFVGPYEPRKQPELFVSVCKATKLPALLITPSQTSAEKFKKRFLEEGIEHEIYIGLSGQNKVSIIKKAAAALITSKEETFCYTAFEAAHSCRTILPAEREWTRAHSNWCILAKESEMAAVVLENYGKPQTPQVQHTLRNHAALADKINLDLINKPKTKFKAHNAFVKALDQHEQIKVEDFYANRPSITIDELYYPVALQWHSDYEIVHTKTATYWRKLPKDATD